MSQPPSNAPKTFSQSLASGLAGSFLLRGGKKLHEQHINDYVLGGSFLNKLLANVYLILHDYGTGAFPPKLGTREETFAQEREQFHNMEAYSLEENVEFTMRKPFHCAQLDYYMRCFCYMVELMEKRGVKSGAKLMEMGCGAGWLAEMLCLQGYDVTGTTIAQVDVDTGNRRVEALKIKGVNPTLRFAACPMEEVDKHLGKDKFDVVFCFEALHHVYSWRESVDAAYRALKPGGYLLICSEPPTLHTYVCYRSSKILKTHEIGFNAGEMVRYLRQAGYQDVQLTRPAFIGKISEVWKYFLPFVINGGSIMSKAIWVAARKP